MLGNPACPDQLSSSDHDDQDYRRYRSYVVHRIPLLRFLDSGAIKPIEREEATQRGHYYRLIRLNSDSVCTLTLYQMEANVYSNMNTIPYVSYIP